jgi:hypothetical protein
LAGSILTPALDFGNDTNTIPVPADCCGDGKADPAVFEKATGHWFVIGSQDGFSWFSIRNYPDD